MTIRISRNAAGNCINFIGSSLPAYFNACLSGEVDADDNTLVSVVNDIQTASNPNGEIRYEFYQIPYTEFADKDGNPFVDAQAAADYITQEGQVLGVSDTGTDLTGVVVNFRLDQTSTSVIMDNGAAFGVNTIKAVPDTDGTIHIHAIGAGVPEDSNEPDDHKHYEKLDHTNVQINGSAVSGGLNDVCNALNELFTVGAFESVVISDPYATMIADVDGTPAGHSLVGNTSVDPIGNDIFGNTGSGNYAGLLSSETIDQAGEYYTFDIRGEGTIGFGLVHTQDSYDGGYFSGNSNYADPASFAVSNSAHYGYQFSHWFHPTPNGSWTNYGANTGYSMRAGWSNWDQKADWLAGNPVKIRCGIDTNGYISIESLQDDGSWVVHTRTSYPVAQGSEFRLGIKASSSSARVYSSPKVHLLEPAAPVMYFRYIESPDGNYEYPLFATAEEAEYYDLNHDGTTGTGTSHQHVYVDDPTGTTWYMPDTGRIMNGNTPPQDVLHTVFQGNSVAYTEITSLTNSGLAPPTFSAYDLTVDEGESINYQTQPQDTAYTTTITGLPLGLIDAGGGMIGGTAPEVSGDNVAYPSETYTVTVTRTNSYGSSTGTFDIIVNNLTAPVITAVAGFTHVAGSTPLVDSDTLADGSVVVIDDVVDSGNRLHVDSDFLSNYVLPRLVTSDSGNPTDPNVERVFIGIPLDTADFSNGISEADFLTGVMIQRNGASSIRYRTITNGVYRSSTGMGTSNTTLTWEIVFQNYGTEVEVGVANSTTNPESTLSATDGGSWTTSYQWYPVTDQNREVVIGVENTTMDLPTGSPTGLNETVNPSPAPSIQTPWTKALDFSGSSERAVQVSTSSSYNALRMRHFSGTVAGNSTTGFTSDQGSACPWATAIVFKPDGNSSNQHIWNQGEGAGSDDDNIYLRLDASGNLYFGWGRSGAVNECVIGAGFNAGAGINQFWGVYIAHNGTRLSGTNATASNLAECFDIRVMNNQGGTWQIAGAGGSFADAVGNRSTVTNWSRSGSSTGGRMDRRIDGDFTIGGRGSNRNFHGKVAAMTVTTLQRGVAMPSDAEIAMLVTDPNQWISAYRVNNTFRTAGSSVSTSWNSASLGSKAQGVQMWLMGDTGTDSYSNMIRNRVYPSDQNYTKLNMISMVSNDIQSVNISGLS